MTPRAMKEAMYLAADTNDAPVALYLVKELKKAGWWIWEGKAADISSDAIPKVAAYDGHCQVCDQWFPAGTAIRWSAGSCSHVECWERRFSGVA